MKLIKEYRFPLIIAAAVLAVYGQCLFFQFQHWDDGYYLLDNPFLKEFSWGSIKAIFTLGSLPEESLYIPISYLSFLLEGAWFGFNPMVAHSINVVLHLANSLLVFMIVKTVFQNDNLTKTLPLQSPIPLVAALIFALYPIQAKSIAGAFFR